MTNTDADNKTTELCNTSACVLCIIVEYSMKSGLAADTLV